MVKSFEHQFHELNSENSTDKKTIEDFLWNSSTTSNEVTLEDIRQKNQLKYGIVTKDGIIIDGNRRALMLSKIFGSAHPIYFKAAILDERLEDNVKEIMRLETTYQMGEDAKVDYNAIEKYLKCKDLRELGFTNEEIAKMMGERVPDIKTYLATMGYMDDYLKKVGYDGIYTRLEKTEGLFVNLVAYLDAYGHSYDEESGLFKYRNAGRGRQKMDWNPGSDDLNDLKLIYYDVIRARFSGEGKEYRQLGKPDKDDSIFCKEAVWEEFKKNHFEKIEPLTDAEPSVKQISEENPKGDLAKLLRVRDEAWGKQASGYLKGNMGIAIRRLDDLKEKTAPMKLLQKALDTLEVIDCQNEAFYDDPAAEDLTNKINKLMWDFKQAIKHNRR